MDSKIVLSLFDASGIMVQPWAEAGYHCITVDIDNDWLENTQVVGWNGGTIHRVRHDIRDWLPPRTEYRIVFAFPPLQ